MTSTKLKPPLGNSWLVLFVFVWSCAGVVVQAAPTNSAVHHVKVYAEPGRFGGWPANHGIWSWGNEILVGFSRGYYKDLGERHNIERELLTASRCRDESKAWIETYRSLDNGEHWTRESVPAPDLGTGNPASMIRLKDGRVCLTYGHRAPPYSMRARLSNDGGHTWAPEIILRDDGGGTDIGYPRSVQRPDGKIVTIYYFHDQPKGDRYIAATIWSPGGEKQGDGETKRRGNEQTRKQRDGEKGRLLGQWTLASDCRDSSGNGNNGINHGVTFRRVEGKRAAVFDGRASWIEVPASPVLQLGENDFTMTARVCIPKEAEQDDAYGDILSLFDPVARRGVNFRITLNTGVTTSQPNARNIHFGIDNGQLETNWTDHGRPGNAILVFALAVHEGQLYAGTCEPGRSQAGHLYRFVTGTNWFDCGSPDPCNSVSSLAVWQGQLYAACSKYRLGGSALPESENPNLGGTIYCYRGDQSWEACGRLPNTEAVGGLVVFRDRLYASSLYRPAGFFRYEGGTRWTSLPTPGGKRVVALSVYNGQLFASSYDQARVFRFDGSAWTDCGQVGPPENTQTYSFAVYQGRLHVGTWSTGRVFRYRGDNDWEDMGRLGQELEVMGMMVHNGQLYAGSLPLAEVYRFNAPGEWTKLACLDATPDVKYRRAWTMAEFQGRLFCGTLPSGRVRSFEAGKSVTYDHPVGTGWHHLAATREGGHLKLWLDGSLVATSAAFDPGSYELSPEQALKIGFGQNDYFRGALRDLRIYDQALSAEEIAKLSR